VPDDLYEKMTEWKSSLNFSKVFQNAISVMIQKKETLTSKIRSEIDFHLSCSLEKRKNRL